MKGPVITKDCVKTLLDGKFIKVYDLQYAEGKHYYDASRREAKDLAAVKTEEFGKFQYLDFSVTSNRTDVPLQACIDYLVTNIEIDY